MKIVNLRRLIFCNLLWIALIGQAQEIAKIAQKDIVQSSYVGSVVNISDQNVLETLDTEFREYALYNINSAALKTYAKSPSFNGELQLRFGANEFSLVIDENDIRSSNYVSRSATPDGIEVDPIAENVLYAGFLDQDGGSYVRMTIEEQMLIALFSLNGEDYLLEPLNRFAQDEYDDVYVFYKASDVKDTGATCMLREIENQERALAPKGGAGQLKVDQCIEVEYAIATDFLTYQANGSSVSQTNSFTLSITNLFIPNYQGQFLDDYDFTVVENFNSTCGSCDPWTSSTDAGTLLDSFTGLGPSNFTNDYDVASLWTDRDFSGSTVGIAWLGTVCFNSRYNCLQSFTGNSQSLRVMTAHELGHNFDMSHDASGAPFIMAPSVNAAAVDWSTASINSLNNHVAGTSCLDFCPSPCPSITDLQAVNCNPGNGTYTLQITINTNGETGPFQIFTNGQFYNFNYASSPQIVGIPFLPSTGTSGNIVELVDTSISCFDQETYDAPNPLCFCTNITSQNFSTCGLPSGWSTDHPDSGFTLGSCEAGTSGFAFNCTEYPGQSSAGMAGPPDDFSGCVAVIDDDNAGNGGPTGTGCIISNGVSTLGYSDISLEFDYQNEVTGQGEGTFTVDVWNGSNWINVFSSTTDANGHVDVDVTSFSNNNFQTRFCYDDEGSWAWGAAIDNYEVCGFQASGTTCNDGIQNGNETGVDCGGSCPPCNVFGCTIPAAHNFDPNANLNDGSCETCSDGVWNGDEEAVDCGGINPNCPVCPTCVDGIQNGNEEDVDCGGDCIACPTCDDGIQNGNELGIDCGGECDACTVPVQLSAYIEGAFDENTLTMRTDLLDNGLLPVAQPYNSAPYFYNGGETISILTGFPDDVVDWVLVQARDENMPEMILSQRACFLRSDGVLIEADGSTGILFTGLLPGESYRFAIHHRSHLPVISAGAIEIPNFVSLDFAFNPNNAQGGSTQLKEIGGGYYGLHSGDVDNNSIINSIDFLAWATSNNDVNVYVDRDLDLNGIVNILDFLLWFDNRSVVGLQFLN